MANTITPPAGLRYRFLSETRVAVYLILGPVFVLWFEGCSEEGMTGRTEDGKLIPSTSVGNNQVFIDSAREVILEVNYYHPLELKGMHDVYEPEMPPDVQPIMILKPSDRIGTPYLTCPPEKIKAIVETNHPDRTTVFKEPDKDSKAISGHILDFFKFEVKKGRLPKNLLPLQSGVGNVANAVLYGLLDSDFEDMTVYTEVIQDGVLALIDAGKITFASSTAFSVSPAMVEKFKENINTYKDKILLRPQSISNHVGIIKRLGVLAMNGCVEFDLYGNVNSTHVNGTRIINGIGGSGFPSPAPCRRTGCRRSPSPGKGGTGSLPKGLTR